MYNQKLNTIIRPVDMMICSMARLLKNSKTVFHGVSSHMPMTAIILAKQLYNEELVYLNIPGGVDPKNVQINSYTSAGYELFNGILSEFPLIDIFDLSMRGGLDVAFLSGVQFDKSGNVNASVIGNFKRPKVRLPGGAGSAVLIPTANRAIIWRTKHDKRTFVNKVDFITTKGNLDRIVTPLCVFKFADNKLVLDTIHPYSSLQQVIDNTGFDIEYDKLEYTQPPTEEELKMLNRIDPKDFRNVEFLEKG